MKRNVERAIPEKAAPQSAIPKDAIQGGATPRKATSHKATAGRIALGKAVKGGAARKPAPAPPPAPPAERIAALRRARRSFLGSCGPLAPTEASIAALRPRVRDHLDDVTVEWLTEATAIYPELCLVAEAMHRRHARVLLTCQFGVLLPVPALGVLEALDYDDPECPSEEIEELLAAYRPATEMVLLMVRAGRRGAEYGVFRLPRLAVR